MSTATCQHIGRPVVDCPACGARGIARCACFADVKCPAHVATTTTKENPMAATKPSIKSMVHRCQQINIGPCNGRGWHVYTYHSPTGIMWSEEYRPKYATKREAIEAAREIANEP